MNVRPRLWIPGLALVAATASTSDAATVQHHTLQAWVDPASATLRVVDVVELDPGPDQDISFLLHRDLALTAVEGPSGPLAWATRDRFQPRDFWDQPPYDELGAFNVTRQHVVSRPEAGWSTPVRLRLEFSGAVYDSLRPPRVAYGRGFESTSGLIDPRGAYLAGETFWVPWFGPDQLFPFELTTSLPAGWHSMSQGERAHHATDGDRNVTTWREPLPMESVYLIAGPYEIRESRHRDTAVYTYTYADTPDDLCQTYLEATGRYLDRYEAELGAYPFAKFALAENWWQTGFGMPSFTLLGDRVIRLPFIVDTSYGHEILHNWWGNGVYVASGEGNWCEGLTTYGADYAYKEDQSETAARDTRRDALAAYRDHVLAGGRDFPLRDFRERSDFATQAVGYGKTMMVFHMLRRRLGDDAYRRGLRTLAREYLGRRAGWTEVAGAFSHDGEDLEPWFTQWVDRPGSLVLRADLDGANLRIQHEGDAYRVRVPVRYEVDGAVHDLTVDLDGNEASHRLPAATTWVAVDPDFDLFRRLHREEIPAQLSQTLGAARTALVVGDEETGPRAAALATLAAGWERPGEVARVEAAGIEAGQSVFFLGRGAAQERALEAAARIDGRVRDLVARARAERLSLIFCTRDPDDPEVGWTVVLPADADVVPALGRKLPHYGRSSYLLFDGEDNVEKGVWRTGPSPLRIQRGESP